MNDFTSDSALTSENADTQGKGVGSHNNICDTQPDKTASTGAPGIDTIGLLVNDFTVSGNARLEVRHAEDASTGVTTDRPLYRKDGDGQLVCGQRALLNIPNRSSSKKAAIRMTIKGENRMFINTELPRLLRENNIQPVDRPEELRASLNVLEEKLRRRGIKADIFGAKITKLHVCKNFRTEAPLPDYGSLFDRLSFPYMEQQSYEDGGFFWRNGSRGFLVYSKGKKHGLGEGLQRAEYRLTKGSSIRRHLNIETVAGLLRQFERMQEAFRDAAEDLLPDRDLDADIDPSCTEEALRIGLEILAEEGSSPYSKILQVLGIGRLLETGQVGAFLSAVQDAGNRKTKGRYRDKLEELAPIADLLSEEGRTDQDRLEELREKLL